jgi:hypothetical protein
MGKNHDLKLYSYRDNNEDWFRLEFDQMISHFFSHSIASNVGGDFEELDGKTVFICIVYPSKSGPFFMKGQDGADEFYVRGLASTQQLRSKSEIERYCAERWPNINN